MLGWLREPDHATDVAAYLLTVGVAVASSWRAADLAWGVWVTGIVGSVATVAVPWLLLTFFPGVSPDESGAEAVRATRVRWAESLLFLAFVWGFVLGGYTIAGLYLIDWVPLPAELSMPKTVFSLVEAFWICFVAYWGMAAVAFVAHLVHVVRAIRAGRTSPSHPFVSVGRVLVVATMMSGLLWVTVDSVAVAILLFVLYIPDDVFGEKVLGLY